MRKQFTIPLPPLTDPWTLGDVRAHWSDLLGPMLCGCTSPRHMLPDGGLVIRVQTRDWLKEITVLEASLRASLPAIVDGVRLQRLSLELSPAADPDERDDDDEPWKLSPHPVPVT